MKDAIYIPAYSDGLMNLLEKDDADASEKYQSSFDKKKSLRIVAIDYGIKKNILRYFSNYNCEVKVVSCKQTAEEIL